MVSAHADGCTMKEGHKAATAEPKAKEEQSQGHQPGAPWRPAHHRRLGPVRASRAEMDFAPCSTSACHLTVPRAKGRRCRSGCCPGRSTHTSTIDTNSAECQAWTESLLLQNHPAAKRHLGARVIISTQEPTIYHPKTVGLCASV
ncbi:LOW QUALITY PROTEIN: uncharacterized protein QC761_0023870 [Podospora bellae-mahoneyi]|uniref:Uncharacterized protein n=1 Tax=Podospora bellae-mahoneyi TaxID=2093777 RepID=A0ABR0G1Q9_9PEZI|nr:LOW QUALITY PROTEIN: hypothetical protein QC761_0023870 [Podospora bellae-mahoneyi]